MHCFGEKFQLNSVAVYASFHSCSTLSHFSIKKNISPILKFFICLATISSAPPLQHQHPPEPLVPGRMDPHFNDVWTKFRPDHLKAEMETPVSTYLSFFWLQTKGQSLSIIYFNKRRSNMPGYLFGGDRQ